MLVVLEEVMTMDRNAMGHTLVRFYLAHGSVLPFLDALNIREIHQTSKMESQRIWNGESSYDLKGTVRQHQSHCLIIQYDTCMHLQASAGAAEAAPPLLFFASIFGHRTWYDVLNPDFSPQLFPILSSGATHLLQSHLISS